MAKSSIYNPRVVKTQSIIRHYGWLNREQGPKMDLKFAGESWNLIQRRLHGMEGRGGSVRGDDYATGVILWGAMKGALRGFQSGSCVYGAQAINYPYRGVDVYLPRFQAPPFPWNPFPPPMVYRCHDLWTLNPGLADIQNGANAYAQISPMLGTQPIECWKMTCGDLWAMHPAHDEDRALANENLVVWPDTLAEGSPAECWLTGQPPGVPDGPPVEPITDPGDKPAMDAEIEAYPIEIYRLAREFGYRLTDELYFVVDKSVQGWEDALAALFPFKHVFEMGKTQTENSRATVASAQGATIIDREKPRRGEDSMRLQESARTLPGGYADGTPTVELAGFASGGIISESFVKTPQSELSLRYAASLPGFGLAAETLPLPLEHTTEITVDGVNRRDETIRDKGRKRIKVKLVDVNFPKDVKLIVTRIHPDTSDPNYPNTESYLTQELQRTLLFQGWVTEYDGFTFPMPVPRYTLNSTVNLHQRKENHQWYPSTAPGGYTLNLQLNFFPYLGQITGIASAPGRTQVLGKAFFGVTGVIGTTHDIAEWHLPPYDINTSAEIACSFDDDMVLSFNNPLAKRVVFVNENGSTRYVEFGIRTDGEAT